MSELIPLGKDKYNLIHGDCMRVLPNLPRVKSIFLDPPDNLGLKYEGYTDFRPFYYAWLRELIEKSLDKCEILWISYYWKHDVEVKKIAWDILQSRLAWKLKTFIWKYGFGQHNQGDFTSSYRFILRFSLPSAVLHMDQVKIPSWRQLNGDPRAAPGGRNPDDYWIDEPETFDIPRVTGNSKERRLWHPTQHPEKLMKKVIAQSCGGSETFCDLFLGSGTSLRCCKRLGVPFIGVEISDYYCRQIRKDFPSLSFSEVKG